MPSNLADEIEKLMGEATKAPWKPETGAIQCMGGEPYDFWYARGPLSKVVGFEEGKARAMVDARLIVHLANSAPAIVASLKRVERLEAALRWITEEARKPGLYHGGETYAGLCARMRDQAREALKPKCL